METGRIISHIESAHARSPPDDFTQQENGTIRNSTTDSFFFLLSKWSCFDVHQVISFIRIRRRRTRLYHSCPQFCCVATHHSLLHKVVKMASLNNCRIATKLFRQRGGNISQCFQSTAAAGATAVKHSPNLAAELKWSDAKPFDEMPGPKRVPVLGSTWMFLPIIGDLTLIEN